MRTMPDGMQSGEYRGILTAAAAGSYGFALDADSSAQLFVDDVLVVDNGGGHRPQRIEGYAQLTAGPHVGSIQYSRASPSPWGLYLQISRGGVGTGERSRVRTTSGPYVPRAQVMLQPDEAFRDRGATA